jgi:hypothetical protein
VAELLEDRRQVTDALSNTGTTGTAGEGSPARREVRQEGSTPRRSTPKNQW